MKKGLSRPKTKVSLYLLYDFIPPKGDPQGFFPARRPSGIIQLFQSILFSPAKARLHQSTVSPPAEALGEGSCIRDWQMVEDTGSVDVALDVQDGQMPQSTGCTRAAQHQGMPMGIEAEHVPEGLVRDDNARAHIRPGRLPAVLFQKFINDPGNPGKEPAIIPEIGTQQIGDDED